MTSHEFQNYRENKIHTPDRFPYNTYLCSIPLDFTDVPLHWHAEAELIVIKKGSGTVSVDLNRYPVSANDILIVLPGHLHSIHELPGHTMEYENILFRTELLFSRTDDICSDTFLAPLLEGKFTVEHYIRPGLSCYESILSLVQEMDSLCQTQPEGYQLALKGYLFQLFYLLIANRNQKVPTKSELRVLEKLKYIIGYIETHYAEPITIPQMADLCYFSPSHFMKFFKANMGVSFIQYLNNYRLTAARRLLGASSLSILEIAQQCGFENLSYFNRLFKQKFGITPRQAR